MTGRIRLWPRFTGPCSLRAIAEGDETMSTIRHSSHWGAFSAIVEDGRLTGVVPFETDPYPAEILDAVPSALYHECRVAQPMVRRGWLENGPAAGGAGRGGEAFVPVSWDKALSLITEELKRVKAAYGNEAIFGGSYGWSSAGRFHHAKTQLQRFLNCHGGFTAQVHSYSIAAGLAILPHILGDIQSLRNVTSWRSIAQNTKLFVAFGGIGTKNTQVEPGGAGQHSTAYWLHQLKDAGVQVVSVTPLREDTPAFLGAEWLAPRPNTDVALMLGLAHTIFSEGLHDPDFLSRCCVGFEKFERYLTGAADGQPKSADWAAPITGTSYSLQRGDHGEQTFWMTMTLAAMLGQVGLPGGGFGFGYGSMQGQGNPVEPIAVPAMQSGANPTGSFIPVARVVDMLLNPGGEYDFNGKRRKYPDTKLVYWCGGNPFHHHQDINRLIEGWRRPETVIVHEPWWTATARHADIVLPATTTLERNDIGASGRDRFIMAMHKAVEPVGNARHDFDIFADLAERMGFRSEFTEDRDEMDWLRHLYDVSRQQAAQSQVEMPDFETFWAEGYVEIPEPGEPHVVFADFRRDPAANPLKTPSGLMEIFSETIDGFGYDDCPGHPVWLEPVEWLGSEQARRHPLHLMSNQPDTRLHAQMDCGSVSVASKIAGREPVTLNPADAAARGIRDGDIVRVFNDRGETLAGAILSDGVMPGVIRLATGAWYDPAEPGRIGTLDKHGNPNMLTIDRGTSKLGQGPVAHSTLVEVERYAGELPAITAFTGPTAKAV
jgi:biotin/methionine sulfoxide reductase